MSQEFNSNGFSYHREQNGFSYHSSDSVVVCSYSVLVERVEELKPEDPNEQSGKSVWGSRGGYMTFVAENIAVPLDVSLEGEEFIRAYQLRLFREVAPGDTVEQITISARVLNSYGLYSGSEGVLMNRIVKADQQHG